MSKDIALVSPRLVNYYKRKIDSGGTWLSRSFYGGHSLGISNSKKPIIIPYMGIGLIRKKLSKSRAISLTLIFLFMQRMLTSE